MRSAWMNWLLALLFSMMFVCLGVLAVLYDKDMPDLSLAEDRFGESYAQSMHAQVYDYLYYGDEMDAKIFSPQEIAHMHDVRAWILRAHYVLFFSLMIGGLMLYRFERLGVDMRSLRNYAILCLAGLALCLVVSSWFHGFFEVFHKIFFVTNYTFPQGSPLVTLYTYDFFRLAALRALGVWVVSGIVAALVWLAWRFRTLS